jgi:hypothetical protein
MQQKDLNLDSAVERFWHPVGRFLQNTVHLLDSPLYLPIRADRFDSQLKSTAARYDSPGRAEFVENHEISEKSVPDSRIGSCLNPELP